MAKESLDQQMKNLKPRFNEAEIEQIASDEKKFNELMSQLTIVSGQINESEQIQRIPAPQKKHDECKLLAEKARRVIELQNTKHN